MNGSKCRPGSEPDTGRLDADAQLEADIRRLDSLLGRTLVRQEGRQLVDLVERVRVLSKSDRGAAALELSRVDALTATRLVRAFTTYFHLANVAEQVHRARELARARERGGGWLAQAVARIVAAGPPRDQLEAALGRLAVRPVFTAHPSQPARGTMLAKLRQVGDLLEAPACTPADGRLEELIDPIWQTDELRIARPDVVDEARNAVYYFDELHADAVPHVLEELTAQLARLGFELGVDARPLSFGSWIGGDRDGNPNVSAKSTADVLALHHEHGIRRALAVVDDLRRNLSTSVRIADVTASSRPRSRAISKSCPSSSRATAGSTRRSRIG